MSYNIDFTQTLLYQEGKLEGKLEQKIIDTLETGRTMLEKGYTIFQVQDVTGLTFEQIQKLQNELGL